MPSWEIRDVASLDIGRQVLLEVPEVQACRVTLARLSESSQSLRDSLIATGVSLNLRRASPETERELRHKTALRSTFDERSIPLNFESQAADQSDMRMFIRPDFLLGYGLNGEEIRYGLGGSNASTFVLQGNESQAISNGKHVDQISLAVCFYMHGQGIAYYDRCTGQTLLKPDPTSEDGPFYLMMHRGKDHPQAQLDSRRAVEHEGFPQDGARASLSVGYAQADLA